MVRGRSPGRRKFTGSLLQRIRCLQIPSFFASTNVQNIARKPEPLIEALEGLLLARWAIEPSHGAKEPFASRADTKRRSRDALIGRHRRIVKDTARRDKFDDVLPGYCQGTDLRAFISDAQLGLSTG